MHLGKVSVAAVLAFGLCGAPAWAEVTKVWELGGFDTPESALPDPASGVIYVSNVAGALDAKDGRGFISKVSLDGAMIQTEWVGGLDAPKGLALSGGKLYVADIDRLAVIDVASGRIEARFPAPGAKFLNDVAADDQGRVYVSDMRDDTIWRLSGTTFEPWVEDKGLKGPNGLHVQDGRIIVAAWGVTSEGSDTTTPGNLVEVSVAERKVRDLGSGTPVGALDGIVPAGADSYLVTEWMNGGLYRIRATGEVERLVPLKRGSADLGYLPDRRTALVPMMMDNQLVAYRID